DHHQVGHGTVHNQPGFQTREGQERCYRRHPNLSWEENNRAARRRTGEGCHPPSIYERRLRSPRACVDRSYSKCNDKSSITLVLPLAVNNSTTREMCVGRNESLPY